MLTEFTGIVATVMVLASASIWEQREEPNPITPPVRHNPPTHYEKMWDGAKIRPNVVFRLDKAIAIYEDNKHRYKAIEKLRKGGVPAQVISVLHMRESTWNFNRHLHEGSSLQRRTRYVPKGRPRKGRPPFTFEESAEDALYILKGLESVDWTDTQSVFKAIERYNGTGYLRYHKDVPSPYLYSGLYYYSRGKYVADGRFSHTAIDKQLGCMTVLKRMEQRHMKLPFR
jgi:lysozyme family protein